MSQFTSIERRIASALSNVPFLKRIIKRAYQAVTYPLYRSPYRKKTICEVQPVGDVAQERSNVSTFFGYYDHCPLSETGEYILQHVYDGPTTHRPDSDDTVRVCAVEGKSGAVACSFPSSAFNWQQGTRLQWVDTDTFAFNDLSDDRSHYVARTASVDRRTLVRCYDRPLQDGYKHDYFLSLNYRRLRALRPDYGYFSLPRLTASECENLDDDGIWTVDYDTGAETLIYTLQQIRDHKPQPEFDTSVHYVNHCMIAPGGDRFVFLHRYIDAGGRRIDRLFVGGRSGDSPELLVDTGFISHYCWVDDHTLLGYMRGRDETDGYYTVDVDTGAMLPVLNRRLDGNGDGHPSVCGSKFVIDTYPSKGRMQTLLLVDRDDQSVREIAEFRHGLQYDAETRCDLHPRLSPDGTSVFFDSVFSGTRKQYRMPLAAEATS